MAGSKHTPGEPPQTVAAADRPVVEIGWMLVGRMGPADLQAAMQARHAVRNRLAELLPEFQWRLPLVRHEEFIQEPRQHVMPLFDFAATERHLRRWDLAMLITEADLIGYERSFTLAALSTALGAAVISTFQLDPAVREPGSSDDERTAAMAARIEAIVLHCLGHFTGLQHDDAPVTTMAAIQSAEDLDASRGFSTEQQERMSRALHEIADRRLEERPEWQRASTLSFYVRSTWLNRREIVQAVFKAQPWLLPIRLSRLAAAALSAMVILLMTAESWELGMSLAPGTAVGRAALCTVATTAYVIVRQRLLVRREQRGAREQKVIANVAATSIVLWGMLTSFAGLFGLTLLVAQTVFSQSVVESWAASVQVIGWPQYLCLSAYIASVALVVGALGASFEDQQYFRHATLVDEEI